MRNLVTRFAKDEQGAALVEYGLLVGLIAVVCRAGVTGLGHSLSTVWGRLNTELSGV
jgi:pilus assembly protein Flp/PilA